MKYVSPFRPAVAGRMALTFVVACCALAWTVPAVAQERSRNILILGLRAPDGDDDAATQVTAALRRAVRAAGFTTGDDSPGLEQQIAAFGCDDAVPADCLAQIANDLHGDRMIWGAVRRQGRGRAAQLEIRVSLYDNVSHANATSDMAVVARATAQDSDALSSTARRLVRALLPESAGGASAGGGGTSAPGGGGSAGQGHDVAPPPPGRPVAIRRYIGIGALIAGGALIITGAVFGIMFTSLDGECNGSPDACGGWVRAVPNGTTPEVCAAANNPSLRTETGSPPVDWNRVSQVCGSQGGLSTNGWLLSSIGIALVGTGLILALTDHTGQDTPPATARRRDTLRPVFSASPLLAPGIQGATFGVRF